MEANTAMPVDTMGSVGMNFRNWSAAVGVGGDHEHGAGGGAD